MVNRDDVEAGVLGDAGELRVRSRRLVRLEAETDLAPPAYVSSSLRIVRSPIRSIRITTRSSGWKMRNTPPASPDGPPS